MPLRTVHTRDKVYAGYISGALVCNTHSNKWAMKRENVITGREGGGARHKDDGGVKKRNLVVKCATAFNRREGYGVVDCLRKG